MKWGAVAVTAFLLLLTVAMASVSPHAEEVDAETQTVSLSQMVTDVIDAGTGDDGCYSKTVSGALFDYAVGYGGLDEEGTMRFRPYEVNNGGLRTAAVYNESGYQCSVLLTAGTGRASNFALVEGEFVGGSYGAVAKLIAKENLLITITNGERENNEANLNVGVYTEKSDGEIRTETTIPVGESVAADVLGGEFYVAKGSSLYYVFYTDAYGGSDTKYARTFYSAIWPAFQAVVSAPIPVIEAAADKELIVAGEQVTLTWSATESAQVSVSYTKDDEASSGLAPVSGEPFTIDEAGTYVFTFEAEGAVSKQVTVTVQKPAEQTELEMTLEQMVQASIAAGGNLMESIGVSWRLEYGKVGERLYNFTDNGGPYVNSEGVVSKTRIDSEARNSSGYAAVYFDSDYQGSGNGRLRTDHGNGYDFVISFTATQNVVVYVTNEAWIKGADSLGAEYSSVVMRTVEGKDYYVTTNYIKQSYPSSVEENVLGQEIHLAAGDRLYYVINGVNDSGYVTLLPDFSAATEGYDAGKVFDFSGYIAAVEHAAEVKEKVQAAYDAVSFEDYEAADYLEICELYESALEKINAAVTSEEVDAVAAELQGALANYLTKEQAVSRRAELVRQLNDYVAALDRADYSEEDWAALTDICDGFADTVASMTRENDLTAAYEAAKASIDAFSAGGSKEDEDGGCSSSATGTSALIVSGAFVSLGAAVVAVKKRVKK